MMQEKKRSSWREYPTLELEITTKADVSVGDEFAERRFERRAIAAGGVNARRSLNREVAQRRARRTSWA